MLFKACLLICQIGAFAKVKNLGIQSSLCAVSRLNNRSDQGMQHNWLRLFEGIVMGIYFFITLALSALLFIDISHSRESKKCLSNYDLIQVDNFDKRNISPCTELGAAYLFGLGRTGLPPKGFEGNYSNQFYFFSRTYLSDLEKKKRGELHGVDDGILFLLISSLLNSDTKANPDRIAIYKAFVLWKYVSNRKNISRDILSMLLMEAEIAAYYVPLETYGELDCFIRHDIPSVSIPKIINSKSFKKCMEKVNG